LPLELRCLTGLALAVAVVYATTPLAIRVADRLEFYDRPVGYKAHGSPTPYLGGAAVTVGFLVAVAALTSEWERTLPLAGGVAVMWAVGTWDDRHTVSPWARVLVEVLLAAAFWGLNLGWNLGAGPAVDLAVTIVWFVAVVNAFNLFDNMDGATPSMGTVAAGGLAALGALQGSAWLAVTAAALCGACAGFLPHNLRSPARIFLGDGGSMPIGFAVAALTMIGVSDSAVAWQSLAMAVLFVGVPALDTALVMVSRRRRGISLLTGGRDHLTHRTREWLLTARSVALALGTVQALTSALAIVALRGGTSTTAAVALYVVAGAVAIALLDTRWAPAEAGRADGSAAPRARVVMRLPPPVAVAVVLAVLLGAGPLFRGYYDAAVWAPAALVLVVALIAGMIGRPLRPSGSGALLLAGLAGLGLLSLVSAQWAESAQQAFETGNRYLAYAALAGVALIAIRTEAAATWLMAALGAVTLVLAAVTLVRMTGSAAGELFVAGRLDAPLGYINGQAAAHLLGFWCLVAVAEQRRWPVAAAAGAAGATLVAALLLLAQSRGVAIALIASAAIVLAAVPGRTRRACVLLVVAAGVAAASPVLLDVWTAGRDGAVPAGVAQAAARAAALAAPAAGTVWALAVLSAGRLGPRRRQVRRAAAAVLTVAVVAGAAVAVAQHAAIGRELDRQYTAFTRTGDGAGGDGATRLASGSGNRYDYWRVALAVWRDRPVAGVGAGNYEQEYFLRRRTTEDVQQPHSLELQVLSELGLVGLVPLGMLLLALGLGAAGLARAARRSAAASFQAVAAIGCVAAWLVQTSVDWLHLLPGVTGVALAGAVVLVRRRSPVVSAPTGHAAPMAGHPAAPRRRAVPVIAALALGLTMLVASASLARQVLSERYLREAQSALARDPARALRLADQTLRLDRGAVDAYYVKSAAFARFGEAQAARAALAEAARHEPGDHVTWALMGDLALRMGKRDAAHRAYRRALSLNPRDPALGRSVRETRAG
jgi:UDP-GlcNAc:undecaprenyl-phosphate GlcNAc-1-phosphate transferase